MLVSIIINIYPSHKVIYRKSKFQIKNNEVVRSIIPFLATHSVSLPI